MPSDGKNSPSRHSNCQRGRSRDISSHLDVARWTYENIGISSFLFRDDTDTLRGGGKSSHPKVEILLLDKHGGKTEIGQQNLGHPT